MPVSPRPLVVWCAAALLAAGCSHTVAGTAMRAAAGIDDDSASPVDVEQIILDQTRMRALTGAGDDLTIVPSMDGKFPVDIEPLAKETPPQCQWIFAETQTFGPEVEEFHKTTFQNPPDAGLISEGAAAYRDLDTARRAFDSLVASVRDCQSTSFGPMLLGDWSATADTLQTRQDSTCGRDYRVKSVVVIEVTFCRFPESVSDNVMANILAEVPG